MLLLLMPGHAMPPSLKANNLIAAIHMFKIKLDIPNRASEGFPMPHVLNKKQFTCTRSSPYYVFKMNSDVVTVFAPLDVFFITPLALLEDEGRGSGPMLGKSSVIFNFFEAGSTTD